MTGLTRQVYQADLLVECAEDLSVLTDYFERSGCEPHAVIAGSDSGCPLADTIARHFNLPGNDPVTSAVRYRKAAMADQLERAGLPNIPTLEVSDVEQAHDFLSQYDGPYVVKPDIGIGSRGFHRVENTSELSAALADILRSRNAYGDLHRTAVLQPYLEGTEYAVNTIARDRRTVIMDVWKTVKRRIGEFKIYDLEVLVDPHDRNYQVVTQYVCDVLDVLGVHNGPAHTEVILTADGPVLIETGERIMASVSVAQHSTVFGLSPLNVVADYAFDQIGFERLLQCGYPSPRRAAAMVQMHSELNGVLLAYHNQEIQALSSFYEMDLYISPGGPIEPTRDSYTSPGLIFLVHDEQAQIKADYDRIRQLEREGRRYALA